MAAQLAGQIAMQSVTMKLFDRKTKSEESREREKSATKSMTDLQLMVMKLSFAPVSALTAVPPINLADLSFIEIHKRLTRRTGSEAMRNQIQSLTNGWECTVDLGSAGEFLSTDSFSPPEKDSFGGFTVFMFNPTPHKVSEAEMSKRLDSLICDPKMNAQEWVKDLKTFKYYFPNTVDEVHHMMSCAIEFLNLLAGTQDSIAARGILMQLKQSTSIGMDLN
jgi:hypothetical protein